MANIGIVIATDERTATVERCKTSVCDTCSRKNKIGACDKCADREEQAAERCVEDNSVGAEVGDKVEFVKNRRAGLFFAIVVFAVPMICALVAYLVASMITDDAAVSGRLAILFFAIAMIGAGVYSYKVSKRRCEYMISAVYDEE